MKNLELKMSLLSSLKKSDQSVTGSPCMHFFNHGQVEFGGLAIAPLAPPPPIFTLNCLHCTLMSMASQMIMHAMHVHGVRLVLAIGTYPCNHRLFSNSLNFVLVHGCMYPDTSF